MNVHLSGNKLIIQIFIAIAIGITSFFVYQQYSQSVSDVFFNTDSNFYRVYVGNTAISITVADSESERIQGLSGVEKLGEFEGKLFVFDDEQKYGIWMKDMNFPLDIMWFNNDLKMVYKEENVDPSTYPKVFAPPQEARFVLETNANFIRTLDIQESDTLLLPSAVIPKDIKRNL